MLIATACFAVMNAGIRLLSKDGALPAVEVTFFRAAFGLAFLLPFLFWTGTAPFKTRRLGMHAARGGLQAVSMMLFFIGLSLTPLAKTTAFEFAAPIIATALAIVFLGERLRWRRLLAMGIGLLGVLIVLRPGLVDLTAGPMFVIVSVILWAGCQLMIRSLSRTEGSFTQALYMALFLTPLTALPAGLVWVWPSGWQLVILAGIAGVASFGTICYGEAFRRAEMSAVLPLESTKIVWTASLGFILFAERPDIWTLVGGFIIFAAAAYITIREAQLARATQ